MQAGGRVFTNATNKKCHHILQMVHSSPGWYTDDSLDRPLPRVNELLLRLDRKPITSQEFNPDTE